MSDCNIGVIPTSDGTLHWLELRETTDFPSGKSPSWLSPEEEQYRQLLRSDKRRRDWLLGRHAAKQLVASLVEEMIGREIALNAITILPHADGWPIVTLPHYGDLPPLTLSISHSRDRAFCAAVWGVGKFVGADIEFIEPRLATFPDEYFTALERQFLAAASPEQPTTLTNAIWSGKEAALKAIRRGLAEDTRLVSCLPHPQMIGASEWLPMRIIWDARRQPQPMPPLTGRWRAGDGFVMTLAFASSR